MVRDLLLTMPNYQVSAQLTPGERGNAKASAELC